MKTLDEVCSIAIAGIENYGTITDKQVEADGFLDGDTLGLFVWREVRQSFEEPVGEVNEAGLDTAKHRIDVAIRDLECVKQKLDNIYIGEQCSKCSARLDDGEGYDGLCGNCADKKEKV